MKTFSIGKAISYGWGRVKGNWQVLSVFIFVAYFVNHFLTKAAHGVSFIAGSFNIISFIFGIFVLVSVSRIGLIEGKGQKVTWKDLYMPSLIPYSRMFLFALLIGLAIIVLVLGSFLLTVLTTATFAHLVAIIAGLFITVKFRLVPYAIADGLGVIDALKSSSQITKRCFWSMTGLVFVLSMINCLVIILSFILVYWVGIPPRAVIFLMVFGISFTGPLAFATEGHVYHSLKS